MMGWELVYDAYDVSQEGARETLCTLGNGYFASRGAAEEARADGVHYPGTYIAGCFDRLTTAIEGTAHDNEDLVNAPNWLPLTFREPGGVWFGTEPSDVLCYRQALDLKAGVLTRDIRVRAPNGHITRFVSRRIVHMREPHLAGIEVTLTAENWSGRIEVRSALDGTVANRGVERYRQLDSEHLIPVLTNAIDEELVLLQVQTVQSGIGIVEAARTRVFDGDGLRTCERRTINAKGFVAQELALDIEAQRPVSLEKIVAIYTSRDRAISEPCVAAREHLVDAPNFESLLASHSLAWAHLWRSFDVDIDAGELTDLDTGVILRLHVFHLLQTTSRNSIDLDVSVGARGLHGEAYRGHVFWDELFVFPFFNLRMPDITRSLLMYRYRRLDAARRAARAAGYRGAMYPWQSGSDGREATPVAYWNPRSARWIRDTSYLQRHVGAAIVYNVWQFYQVTGDVKFLEGPGAEMVLEIARFMASLATYDPLLDRYAIRGVMGPDEYHTRYPGAERAGLDNCTYMNVMAVWVLCRALDLLTLIHHDRCRELCEQLDLRSDELENWEAISRKMTVVFLDGGIPAQFEGYDRLAEFDWERYRARYGNIQRLDLILEAEGDDSNRYKLSKQADVLMLFFLFSEPELRALFDRLGYAFASDLVRRTIAYYLQRTSEGSTLSRVAHAWVLSRSDRAGSWRLFREALVSDIADIQGGTTREGIHAGAMAGTLDLLQRCYTGLELREDVLWLDPALPDGVRSLQLLVRYRAHTLVLAITHDAVEVSAEHCNMPSMWVRVRDELHELEPGERWTFRLR